MDAAESWMRDIPSHLAPILIASTQIDLETLKQAIKNAYDVKEDVNYVPEPAPTTVPASVVLAAPVKQDL